MKIREILFKKLLETELFDLAYSRRRAIDMVSDLQDQIAIHLIKTIMYSNSEWTNHWYNELNAWFLKIKLKKLKENNRPLDETTLYNLLFLEPLGTINDVQDIMNIIYKDYPKLSMTFWDAGEIQKIAESMMFSICKDIADKTFTDIRDYIEQSK
jgi:hypothetical protein